MLFLILLLITVTNSRGETGLCDECDCFPPEQPKQVFCDKPKSADRQKIFLPDNRTQRLELLYIYGYDTIEMTNSSFRTEKPLTVIIYGTKYVTLGKHNGNVFTVLHSLTIANVKHLRIKKNALKGIYAPIIRIRNIEEIILEKNAMNINNIAFSLELTNIQKEYSESIFGSIASGNVFQMTNCTVEIQKEAINITARNVFIDHCFFRTIPAESIAIYKDETPSEIKINDNLFLDLYDNSLLVESGNIMVISNVFKTLPAKLIKVQDNQNIINFTDNIINDVDLGGTILNTDFRSVIFQNNTINCNCWPTITSILRQQEYFYSLPNLQRIFENNYCISDCNVTLMEFSNYLVEGQVCKKNDTILTVEELCNLTETTTVNSSTESSQSTRRELSRGNAIGINYILYLITTVLICLYYQTVK